MALNRRRATLGFTLLELLVVVAIIGLLSAYVGPRVLSHLGRSETAVAKAQVDAFAKALDTYRLDIGRYPTTEQGLNALVVAPATETRWRGPYLGKAVQTIPGAAPMFIVRPAPARISTWFPTARTAARAAVPRMPTFPISAPPRGGPYKMKSMAFFYARTPAPGGHGQRSVSRLKERQGAV